MVKNTTGGSKTKGMARKHCNVAKSDKVRTPENNLEKFGYVSKMFGHGMCEIFINNEEKLVGHIRKKFKGRQRRHNAISTGSIVLIGLREWETPYKNCDILTTYDYQDILFLQNKPDPDSNFSSVFEFYNGKDFSNDSHEIIFEHYSNDNNHDNDNENINTDTTLHEHEHEHEHELIDFDSI